jgi:hypothetical protein
LPSEISRRNLKALNAQATPHIDYSIPIIKDCYQPLTINIEHTFHEFSLYFGIIPTISGATHGEGKIQLFSGEGSVATQPMNCV